MKNPMTPAGIEPATFQFVAQHLNHCATVVPGPVWTGEKSRPHWDFIPDRPARSSVAISTELPGPHTYGRAVNN